MKRIYILLLLLAFFGSLSAQTEKAKSMYEEITSGKITKEKFLKQNFADVDSTSMHDLAIMFYRAEDYAMAGSCWEVALSKVKKHGKAYERILNCLSAVYTENTDPEKIQWLMEVVEEHIVDKLLKECYDYKCKLERAQYYIMHGDELKAKQYLGDAMELCQTDEERVEIDEAYASTLFDIRDFEGSAQYYYSASKRWKSLGNMDEAVNALHMSALNYIVSSKYDIAEDRAREAMEASEAQSTEKQKKLYLLCVASLGDALFCQQKYEEALAIYTVELEGYASWQPNSEKHADALEDLGKVEVRMKRFDAAKQHLQQAVDIYKTLGKDDKYSNTYSELLVCLRKAGDNDAADAMEQEADQKRQIVWQRLLDSELSSIDVTKKYLSGVVYTNSLNTIAGCYFGLDQYEKAAEYYALYTNTMRDMLRERFLQLTDVDRKRVWKEQQDHIDEFRFDIATLPDSVNNLMPLFIPTLYDMELISKGIMLNSVIEFEKVLANNNDAKLLSIYQQIKHNQQQIDVLQQSASDENLSKVLLLKQKNATLERQLMQGCAAYSDYTQYLSYTWKDVQKKLGTEDVAIEFTTVPMSPLDKDNYLLALILTSKGEPTMEVISTKAILKNLESKDDLYDNPYYYQFVWGFMKKHLDGKKRVYFAPENNLSNVAIEYLKDGEQSFFEKYEVYRLSSTKELCRGYQKTASKKTLCIFGDVDYQVKQMTEQRGGTLAFGQLAYSKVEVDGIRQSMKKTFDVKVYDGIKATEKQFRMLSDNSPLILHISSHGEYSGDAKTTENEAMDYSILALSGANKGSSDLKNDGIISAADVAQMNLRNCDLAVLSACKTALGGKGADGIFGLQRGFKNAGVHSILMSLKPVYDESTAKLMVTFYQGLATGKSKRQALLDAQKKLRQEDKYKAGKYWAPFILLDALD